MAKKESNSLAAIPGALVLVGAGKMGGACSRAGSPASCRRKKSSFWSRRPSKAIKALGKRGVRINPKGDVARSPPCDRGEAAERARRTAAARRADRSKDRGGLDHGRADNRLSRTHLPNAAIVRAMPNTPAAIGRGITVAVGNRRVEAKSRRLAHGLLAATGSVEWIDDEALMDA